MVAVSDLLKLELTVGLPICGLLAHIPATRPCVAGSFCLFNDSKLQFRSHAHRNLDIACSNLHVVSIHSEVFNPAVIEHILALYFRNIFQ
jgi:hypothetical protein